MKKSFVKDRDGAWLVAGSLDGRPYDGNGKPFAFKKRDADFLCKHFGCTQYPAEGTEQQVQADSDLLVYEAQMPQKG